MSAQSIPEALYSIGEVVSLLKVDFPDITITKVRFLENEGLVTPTRTPSGYRKYAEAHVDRLRYILQIQRDHYAPLKVIREQLEAYDRGERALDRIPTPGPILAGHESEHGGAEVTQLHPGRKSSELGPTAEDFRPATVDLRMTRRELMASAKIDAEMLKELESHHLIVPALGTGYYDSDALSVALIAVELSAFGVQPRHLRAFKLAADREIDLVSQVVTPLVRNRVAGESERAADAAREMAALTLRLHVALVKAGLSHKFGG